MGFGQDFSDLNSGQDDIKLKGGTDGTIIGNNGDKLKIDGSGVTQPISAVALPLPADASTATGQASQLTALQLIDDVPSAMNGAFSKGNPVMGQLDDTATTAATEGNVAPVRITAQRAVHTNLRNASGTEVGVLGSPLVVSLTDGAKTSYSANASGFVPPGAATDVFVITGSATKTVKVTRIAISGTTTAGSGFSANLTITRHSTANSAGTAVTATNVPNDSTNAAATAVVKHYTANPTIGTVVGIVRAHRLAVGTVGGSGNTSPFNEWNFGTASAQALVLRGTSEQIAINLGGITITAPVFSVSIEWTEE